MRRVAEWIGRIVLATAGGVLGAALTAGVEAKIVARLGQDASLSALWAADFGVVAPVAIGIAAGTGAFAIVVDPVRPRGPGEHLAWLRAAKGARAVGPLVLLGLAAFAVAIAQIARHRLANGASLDAGVSLAGIAVLLLLAIGAVVFAVTPALDRALEGVRFLGDPAVTTTLGALAFVSLVVAGAMVGNAGGEGPTPLAIFGVLTRKELDLRPLLEVVGIAVFAYVAPVLFAPRGIGWKRAALASAICAAALFATYREARALNGDLRSAALVTQAPLGGPSIALLRRVTDKDHDGASPLFGGGDCNDRDPNIGPNAIDVPGNGIDEDCSGADLPLPEPPAPPPPPPEEAKAVAAHEWNLLFITIDTFRADVGFLGYTKPHSPTPNLDKLAERSTVFERFYALSSYTGKSIGPMMIGKYPGETLRDGAHFNTYFEGNTTVAERLRDAGFHTLGCASFWYFKKSYGMAQGIDDWDMSALPYDYNADTDTSTTSSQLTDVAIKLLTANGDRRFFAWVHYFDPHAQYMGHDEAPSFYGPDTRPGEGAYLGEVWFTDHHIGRLLEYVDAQPWGKDTVIVVTGDHGEAFGEHDLQWHGSDLYEPIVRTPLLIYVPGVTPHRVPVKRSAIDLAPTFLDLMGVAEPPPGELSGFSMVGDLYAADADAGDTPVYDERDIYLDMPPGPILPGRRAFIHGPTPGLKLLQHGFGYEQLVDLAKDPDEMHDVSWDRAKYNDVLGAEERLRGRLHEIWVPPDPPDAKPEEVKSDDAGLAAPVDAATPAASGTVASASSASSVSAGPCTPNVIAGQCTGGQLWHCAPNADRHMLTPRCHPLTLPRPASYGTDECCL